ncbi:PREDICTED: uncharacterized protein LOC109583469 [Amphimedon queenslandica]|uniref:Uncharacterized protein n=1 Tax=Amphimedon queenslandica TaxID=400682 RepID=A0AAN0JBL2_AMPQE|nr:PREDICTED: uncharacterized protein LOC109583469 [Amphimedon queenslandica]|eukprot:XP_019854405.1 PREDICTED: uncharacterized protein LOC109583469 [Amphimedon queenslandica]
MSQAKDQKEFHILAESARSEATKALIVPFDILYSIIAIGVMRNGRDFSTKDQDITLGCLGAAYGVISLVFCLINSQAYLRNAFKNEDCWTRCKKIVIFILDFIVVVATNIIYLVGDSKAEVSTDSAAEERDLTIQGLLFLIPAILSFQVWKPLKTLLETIFKFCKKEDDSEEDKLELDYYKAILYATVMTLSTVPEIDATYTTLSSFVRLTKDNCRPRKYNILWVMYSAIIFNIIVKCISVFLKALRKVYNKNKTKWNLSLIGWAAYAVITSVLAILSTGCFFVVDNDLPLDCSPHFRLNSTYRGLKTKNYNFRIAFLVTSWVLSVAILVMGGICWGRFLRIYDNKSQESYKLEDLTNHLKDPTNHLKDSTNHLKDPTNHLEAQTNQHESVL